MNDSSPALPASQPQPFATWSRLWREPTFWGVTLLVLGFYFTRLEDLSIRGEESRRGRIAWEMLHTGDWLVPRVQGLPRLSRPPLQYWVIAATGWLRGEVDALAVRLPSACATLLTVWLIYAIARTWMSPSGAFCAAVAYATFPQVLQLGRLGETEALFTLTLATTLLWWQRSWSLGWSPWIVWPGAYTLLAIATLAKGPQAPVYFGASVIVWLWWMGDWKKLFQWAHAAGISLCAALVLAWQIPFSLALGREGVARVYLSEVAKRFEDMSWLTWGTHLVAFPWEILLGCVGPWSLLLIAWCFPAVRQILRTERYRGLGSAVLFWTICVVVSFPSVWIPPEARSRYFMPLYPCIALLCGAVVELIAQGTTVAALQSVWAHFAKWSRIAGYAVPAGVCVWALFRGQAALLSLTAYLSLLWGWMWWEVARADKGIPITTDGPHSGPYENLPPTSRSVAVRVVSLGLLLGLTAVGPGMNDQILHSNTTEIEVARIRQLLPPETQLHSFGVVHHLFSYYYADEIVHHDFPQQGVPVADEIDYFCFDAGKKQMAALTCDWEELARINCDRARSQKPECEVILARRVRPALALNATQR